MSTLIFDSLREYNEYKRSYIPGNSPRTSLILVKNIERNTFSIVKNDYGQTACGLPYSAIVKLMEKPLLVYNIAELREYGPPREEPTERKLEAEL